MFYVKNIYILLLIILLFVPAKKVFAATPEYGWTKTMGSTAADSGLLVVDHDGNVIITGTFSNSIDVDFGTGVTSYTSVGSTDAFIAKYDSSGNLLWSHPHQLTYTNSYAYNTVDQDNNIYVLVGVQSPSAQIDLDPTSGTDLYTGTSSTYLLGITKFNKNGDYIWTKKFIGTFTAGATVLVNGLYIKNNSLYALYNLKNTTVDFDPSAQTATHSGTSTRDAVIASYDLDGNYRWKFSIGSTTADDNVTDLATDNDGNIFISGNYAGNVDFDPSVTGTSTKSTNGLGDIFVAKYNNSGEFIWANTLGSSSNETKTRITYDTINNKLIHAITFSSAIDFNTGSDINSISSLGGTDIGINWYDSSGQYIETKNIGNSGNEDISTITFNDDDIYIAGTHNNTVDLDWNSGTTNYNSVNTHQFIAKYSNSKNFQWGVSFGGSTIGAFNFSFGPSSKIYLIGTYSNTVDFNFTTDIDNKISNGGADIYLMHFVDDDDLPLVSFEKDYTKINDRTPTFKGNAQDTDSTIQLVEYQIDSTSGSWLSCIALDGVFDESTESFKCSINNKLSKDKHRIYLRVSDKLGNVTLQDFVSDEFEIITNDKDKKLKCDDTKPPFPTWIKLEPLTKDNIKGFKLTWSQNGADKMNIKIDDGSNKFPYKITNIVNDGHEFIPNIDATQKIMLKPINGCNTEQSYSEQISYKLYPNGWYGK